MIRPTPGLPPVLNCLGTNPTHAANCRPWSNAFASPAVATLVVAGSGPYALDPPEPLGRFLLSGHLGKVSGMAREAFS